MQSAIAVSLTASYDILKCGWIENEGNKKNQKHFITRLESQPQDL